MRFAAKRQVETVTVITGAGPLALPVRRSARAVRLILRVDPKLGGPVLVLPERVGIAEGRRFAESHLGWIESRVRRHGQAVPFRDGVTFPLRGAPCRIVAAPGRGVVRFAAGGGAEGGDVIVPGQPAHLPRRLTDWLKRQARVDLDRAAGRHAGAIDVRFAGLRVGDATTRWGSCSSRGTLSFSWRLVLAPPFVLDYLAAHEVAHLKEMNHGPRFWRLVEQLDPGHRAARRWLKAHGPDLHAIGRG